ncbi:MAG: hypothetical protein FD178_1336 [Ignavibacteria bacterium]|nr:MAG: hypothetical protein FD178_1336 [Ignavibacteria bacterium]
MEHLPIFVLQNQGLFSLKYEGEVFDEFRRVFKLWEDPTYLFEFFTENEADLKSWYGGNISIEDAINITIEDSHMLRKNILDVFKSNEKNPKYLNNIFLPFDNETRSSDQGLERCKAKFKKGWLRVYAINVPDDHFVVTGGTIKLTRKMQDREYTNNELIKITNGLDYLKTNKFLDQDALK